MYQAVFDIGIDGIVGPNTWASLEKRRLNHQPAGIVVPIGASDAPWMSVAMNEKGQKEIVGHFHNPRILEYHATTSLHASTDETPWCSAFVNWSLKQVGMTGTNNALAASWLQWGIPSSVKTGAITVIHNARAAGSGLTATGYYVALLVDQTALHYHLLGGNQSNQVKVSLYPRASWHLVATRWPKN